MPLLEDNRVNTSHIIQLRNWFIFELNSINFYELIKGIMKERDEGE